MIYLDNAATTFPKPEVVYKTMDKYLRNSCVNAGRGSYELANRAMELIDETRNLLLDLVGGCISDNVVFTPSATIAINQVLRGLDWSNIENIYVTPFEHNAIMRTIHYIKKEYDFKINIIPFDNITFNMDSERLKIMFSKDKPDVIIMSQISNVTGYILPVLECHELAKQYEPINIVDCAQSLGILQTSLKDDLKETDFIIFAGHKSLYGPLGIGGFIQVGNRITLNEVITGGTGSESTNLEMPSTLPGKYEAGSSNIYAIVGLNAGLKWINEIGIENIYKHKKNLIDKLVDDLEEIDAVEMYIPENRKYHVGVLSFNINGYSPDEVGNFFNHDMDICVRTGHHCAPVIGKFLRGDAEKGTVRVSVGYFSTLDEIVDLVEAINSIG
ncbi:aminotransferase class V-fold PLP-dependent enzyme [Clostridium botulinum]|uniref:aminotransferase class V-fold PLP-dependent enzyme n=1 Tax=Clostridium sp. ZS6 TaxID=2949987 RepID=UPI0013F96AC3|nr:aminotransferase class V-fold PLP-dependent enzyme [Clostridium sp. ZS6]MBN1038823.1 aminotransferase class V-fold PLP-dependent enzyme [Clostridium botulinum]NFI57513.1 aminotransferase class V-fold PLP-dependent enzyme [Clostridium botulinum]